LNEEDIDIMSGKDCEDCGRMLDLEIDDYESCSDCGEVHFCRVCADALKRDQPYILMCQICEIDYDDAMSENDEFDGGW
tara:strand:- start:5343 stop:5579 length:237 start_codon:yes stop_codon:yes gene_type:complete